MIPTGCTTERATRMFERELSTDDPARRLSSAIRALDLENRRMRAEMVRLVGLSDSEFGAIHVISEIETVTPKALAHELGLTTGAVTAMIDRLERARLIERRPHPSDRRSTILALSATGQTLKEWIFSSYRRAIADTADELGDEATRAAADTLLAAAAFVRASAARLTDDVPEAARVPTR